MRTTWDNTVNQVGTIYGHAISDELQNKKKIDILKPKNNQKFKDKHLERAE